MSNFHSEYTPTLIHSIKICTNSPNHWLIYHSFCCLHITNKTKTLLRFYFHFLKFEFVFVIRVDTHTSRTQPDSEWERKTWSANTKRNKQTKITARGLTLILIFHLLACFSVYFSIILILFVHFVVCTL